MVLGSVMTEDPDNLPKSGHRRSLMASVRPDAALLDHFSHSVGVSMWKPTMNDRRPYASLTRAFEVWRARANVAQSVAEPSSPFNFTARVGAGTGTLTPLTQRSARCKTKNGGANGCIDTIAATTPVDAEADMSSVSQTKQ